MLARPAGTMNHRPGPARAWPTWAALALILAVAAVTRLYALETPELLHDEALVAGAAEHGPGYILRRALASDAHPPYFYMLAKAYMLAGDSEGALRIVSALAGVAAVLALFMLGRRVGSRCGGGIADDAAGRTPGTATGLYASALLAVHLLHVELSRVLRPHSLTILLSILAAGFFLDLLERRDRASLVRLTLTNLGLSFLHFNTLLVVGSEVALASAFLISGRLRPWKYGLGFLGLCLAVLPVNLWFAVARMGRFSGVDTGADMAWTARRSLENLHALLALAPFPAVSWAGWILAAVGLAALFRNDRKTGWVVLGFILLPPAALTAARYGIIYEPWHVAFLAPFLLLACGRALALLPLPATAGAALLALALGACLLTATRDRLYSPLAHMFNHGMGQRELARTLPSLMGPGVLTAFSDPGMRDFTNWYLSRYSTSDLTRFESSDATAGLTLVTPRPPLPPEAAGARLLQALGKPAGRIDTPNWTVSRWDIARSPVAAVDRLPASVTLAANAEDVLAHAAIAKDIAPMLSPLRDALAPLRYDSPAVLAYRVENRSGSPATGLAVSVGLGNSLPENRLSVTVRFDDGPEEPLFSHSAVTSGCTVHALVGKPGGFTSAVISCSMTCSSARPDFYNAPSTILYNGMKVSLQGGDPALDHGTALVESGLAGREDSPSGRYRWGLGPESQLFFVPTQAGEYTLDLAGNSPMEGQAVEVLLDGDLLSRLEFPGHGGKAESRIRFMAQPGNRLITLRYTRFNHGPGGAFAPGDGRLMAVAWTRLALSPVSGGESRLVYVEQ